MRKIFLWFYCLPISYAVILVLIATAVFMLLRKQFGKTKCWKTTMFLLFIGWIIVILFGTIGQRTEGGNLSEPILIPFYSYYTALNGGSRELFRSNFMNMVLFYPAGLLGCESLPKHWRQARKVLLIVCAFLLTSVIIEFCQYLFGLGLAETDDVIHNVFGTLLGGIACCLPIGRKLQKTENKSDIGENNGCNK